MDEYPPPRTKFSRPSGIDRTGHAGRQADGTTDLGSGHWRESKEGSHCRPRASHHGPGRQLAVCRSVNWSCQAAWHSYKALRCFCRPATCFCRAVKWFCIPAQWFCRPNNCSCRPNKCSCGPNKCFCRPNKCSCRPNKCYCRPNKCSCRPNKCSCRPARNSIRPLSWGASWSNFCRNLLINFRNHAKSFRLLNRFCKASTTKKVLVNL